MPSKTKKQEKAMRAAAHSRKVAKQMNIPQNVARKYAKADKAKKRRKAK